MCYFIHLTITAQGRPAKAECVALKLAEDHHLVLRGWFPDGLAITDGHCSCGLVEPGGIKPPVRDFLRELVRDEAVKNIQVGWLFGDEMPADAVVERLSIAEFDARNAAQELAPEVWYRLNAP